MSSSIKIPSRSTPRQGAGAGDKASTASSSSSPNMSSSSMAQGNGQADVLTGSSPTLSSSTFTSSSSAGSGSPRSSHRRRSSYLNSYMSHQDHVVLNVSNNPETVRLLSYVRSGQGFDWNGDLFLPGGSGGGSSYGSSFARAILGGGGGGPGSDEMAMLDHCIPVHEIHLDENEDVDTLMQ